MFYSIASGASVWRGYDYYINNKVIMHNTISNTVFSGKVKGNNNNTFDVTIDVEHPKKSTCNCPHAEGTRKMCKHKVALFFAVFPKEAEKYYEDVVKAQQEEEEYAEELADRLITYVNKMSKSDLQDELLRLLFDGPEYQYNQFLYEHNLDEY